jgi:hypothetical protein
MPHTSWVNLGFYQGAELPDQGGLLEGTGKKLRHVKIRNAAEVGDQGIMTLIQAALAERKQALGK